MHDQDRQSQESSQPKAATGPPEEMPDEAATFPGVLGELKQMLDQLQDRLAQADISQRMARELEQVGSAVRGFKSALSDIVTEVKRLSTDERVLDDLQERCRALSERFYEREVLRPILLRLIGIADRCRDDEGQIRSWIENGSMDSKPALGNLFRCLARARRLDRLEIESALGDLGVVPFHSQASNFSPQKQMIVAPVATPQQSFHGQIARRIRPGYQRGEEIIRPEWVHVYTAEQVAPSSPGDEQ